MTTASKDSTVIIPGTTIITITVTDSANTTSSTIAKTTIVTITAKLQVNYMYLHPGLPTGHGCRATRFAISQSPLRCRLQTARCA